MYNICVHESRVCARALAPMKPPPSAARTTPANTHTYMQPWNLTQEQRARSVTPSMAAIMRLSPPAHGLSVCE